METPFKPEGYNAVSPYFIIDGAQKFVDLLKQIFNATELRRYDTPDGKIMHAEMKVYDSVIMLANSTEKYPALSSVIHVYVPNVDEVFDKAVKAGCEVIEIPQQKGDPDKRGTFRDFAGNMWSVATQQE